MLHSTQVKSIMHNRNINQGSVIVAITCKINTYIDSNGQVPQATAITCRHISSNVRLFSTHHHDWDWTNLIGGPTILNKLWYHIRILAWANSTFTKSNCKMRTVSTYKHIGRPYSIQRLSLPVFEFLVLTRADLVLATIKVKIYVIWCAW